MDSLVTKTARAASWEAARVVLVAVSRGVRIGYHVASLGCARRLEYDYEYDHDYEYE